MAWFTCFWLEKSIIGDENWLGKWLSDPKNRLVLVLPELVVRRGQDLKRCFFLLKIILLDVSPKLVLGKATPWKRSIFVCQKSFFPLIPEMVPWKGRVWKSDFRLPIIVFPSFSRAGALGALTLTTVYMVRSRCKSHAEAWFLEGVWNLILIINRWVCVMCWVLDH